MPIPESLQGRTIAESAILEQTHCTVIALNTNGVTEVNPDPHRPLPEEAEIILIGTVEGEKEFLTLYGSR